MNTTKLTPISTLLVPTFNQKFEDYGSYLETKITNDQVRSILSNEGYSSSIINDYIHYRDQLESARMAMEASVISGSMIIGNSLVVHGPAPTIQAMP